MPGWALIVLAIGAAAATPSANTIYRCPGSDGETMFSDLPCPGGRSQATQPVITIDMAYLSANDQTTLDRLGRDTENRPDKTPALRTDAKSPSPDERRCEAARDGLEEVRAIKRRGYRVSRAASLDARERRYEAQRDRNCVRP